MARYALIIGITEYQSPHLSRLPKAATDAEIVAQVLEQYGEFQVKRVPEGWTGKQPKVGEKKVTGADLGQQLETLLLKQATGSEALIYFAGHGFTVSDNLGEQQGFLATSDCQIEMIGEAAVAQKYGISLESLNKLIAKSELSSLVMLLDCCHSGYFLERNLIQQTLTEFSAQKDYYLITACRTYEQAKSFKGEPHSIFSGALLKGLSIENAASNRRVTGDRLFDFISTELKNSVQEPIRMGWGRSITLVTYPYKEPTPAEVTFNRENPYLGLRAFELEQQKYFFGREQAVRALLDRFRNNRFLAVIGPSGCGKSSLVRAGLLPQLQQDHLVDSSQWAIESFTPGKHPLGALTTILERRHRENQPFILFIDQFEEIFTLCDNPIERQSFVRLMADEATTSDRITRVIATIRGDFLDRCAEYPEAVNLINRAQPTTYVVTPLSRQELEEAIEKPATLHGVKFERGLVSQIVEDVENQAGTLPLLQYALSELWRVFCLQDSSSSQPLLTWKDYEQIGGVKGALDKRATLLYESLTPENQAFVRRLFMELVQVNEGQEVTRRRATWEELEAIADLPEQRQQVIELLADSQQRLIITDENTVDVAHEALLTEWKLLRDWIEENRESLRLRRRLEADCREWLERYEKSDEALLTGARLVAISEWVEKAQLKLPALEAEFLQKSLEKRDRELKAELKQARQLKEVAEARANAEKQRTQLAVGAGVVGVALVTLFGLLQIQFTKISEAKSLTASAQTLKDTNNQLEALMTSVRALNVLKQVYMKQEDLLEQLQTIIYGIQERNRLKGHTAEVIGLSLHPNGKIIASSSASNTNNIKLWSIEGKPLAPLQGQGHTHWVKNVRFSPDGQLLASAGYDKTIKLWSIDKEGNGSLKRTIKGHTSYVYDVKFSPKGKIIASSSKDGTIKLWNTEGNPIDTLQDKSIPQGQDYRVYSIDFHPSGSILASAGYQDGKVNLWKLTARGKKQPIALSQPSEWHKEIVHMVKFSRDGTLLASGSQDGTVKLWQVRDSQGTLLGTIDINGGRSTISGLGFNFDSNILITASDDQTVKLWDIDEAKKLWNSHRTVLTEAILKAKVLKGHTKAVNRVEFSPQNHNLLVSVGSDRLVRLWEVNSNSPKNTQPSPNLGNLLEYGCNSLKNYIDSNQSLSKIKGICRDSN
ncbi:MAG TPA: caspase family protein [Coleofasciculaceae cyanobacterium]|jgi:WD40 repeat protein/energy-coupling factor transporter ATP-binding protein EcfA2